MSSIVSEGDIIKESPYFSQNGTDVDHTASLQPVSNSPDMAYTADTLASSQISTPSNASVLESLGIKTRKDWHQSTAPLQEKPLGLINPIKTYYPTEEQFRNPYAYIQELQIQESEIGAVKIVPPSSFNFDFSLDLQKFSFQAVKQSLVNSSVDNDEKIKFYKKLVKFHYDNKTPITKLPSIDKKVLDLFKLRNSVYEKGGFERVCKKKLWAQIGRELGYTGRIMTSLSSSLKIAYTRILLGFEKEESNGRNVETVPESSEVIAQGSSSEILDVPNENNKRTIAPDTLQEQPQKRSKIKNKPSVITNSRHVFIRPRDILKAKGFNTNFDSYTDERQGITSPDSSTYPYYDFYYWHKGLEIQDHPYPSTELTRSYLFPQFYEIHLRNTKNLVTSTNNEDTALIDEFWRIMKDNDHFNVETAYNLPSSKFGSGFPTANSLNASANDIINPWNLNNLPLDDDGLLRFLNSDNESITKPSLTVSMLHSISTWHTEDHFLYYADYLHLGSNKVWYFIHPEDREKYESLLAKKVEENASESTDEATFEEFSKEPIIADICEGLKHGDPSNYRLNTTNTKFEKLYEHNLSKSSTIHSNLYIDPSILQEHGIRVHYTIQKPGEFIIKFPQTCTSTISLGGSISEGVNFAPISWMKNAVDANKWMVKHSVIPAFSYFQLLVNIVEDSKDASLLKIVHDDFSQFIELELQKRQDLRSSISHLRTINNKFDYICDDTLKNDYPTKLVVTDGDDDFIIDSEVYLSKVNDENVDSDYFRGISKFEMHVYFTDEKLRGLSKTLNTFSQTPEDWLLRYRELLRLDEPLDSERYKPTLKNLKSLLAESERIQGDIEQAKWLADYIEKNSIWVEKAQDLLSARQSNRTRNKRQPEDSKIRSYGKDLSSLNELIKVIPAIDFTVIEFDQVYELYEEIVEYETSVKAFLKEEHSLEEIYEMYDLGKSYGIDLKSLDILEAITARLELIKRYNELVENPERADKQLDAYVDLLETGYNVCTNEDAGLMKHLEEQVKVGKYFTSRINHELASGPTLNILKIDEMLDIIKEYPIAAGSLDALEELKNEHISAVQAKGDIMDIVDQNARKMEQFFKERQLKAAGQPYDEEVYESNIWKFQGDSKDIRPTYSEVRDILDKAKELSPKTDVVGILDHHLRAVEDWLRSCKKLFGKSNAPFHVLTGHLILLLDKIQHSLDLNDTFKIPDPQQAPYCICRRPESGIMICCEKCNEWYHCKCLKLGRGRTKNVEHFSCCICDYRVEYQREFNSPKFEDLEKLLDDSVSLVLCPDELSTVKSIYQVAADYRAVLKTRFNRKEGGEPIPKDIPLDELKFMLRKLQGSSVLLLEEFNELRQETWRRDPCCEIPPPLVESSEKTKKRRKPTEPKNITKPSNTVTPDLTDFELPPLGNFQVALATASLAALPLQKSISPMQAEVPQVSGQSSFVQAPMVESAPVVSTPIEPTPNDATPVLYPLQAQEAMIKEEVNVPTVKDAPVVVPSQTPDIAQPSLEISASQDQDQAQDQPQDQAPEPATLTQEDTTTTS